MWTILQHWLGRGFAEMTPGCPPFTTILLFPTPDRLLHAVHKAGHLPSEMQAPKAKCFASSATGMQEAESHCAVMLSRKQRSATPSHPGNAKTHGARRCVFISD